MKKKILYITIIIVFLIIIFLFLKKKNKKDVNNYDLQKIFDDIKEKYGNEIAKNVEKIYRLETNHFRSKQYKKTGSAGMLAFGNNYPYGWTSLQSFWDTNTKYKPIGVGYEWRNPETGVLYRYLKFDNAGGFYTLAEFLRTHNNNAWRWHSQSYDDDYQKAINNIRVIYTA